MRCRLVTTRCRVRITGESVMAGREKRRMRGSIMRDARGGQYNAVRVIGRHKEGRYNTARDDSYRITER